MASQQQSGRAASQARRQLQVNGKGRSAAATAPTRTRERKSVPAANFASALAPQAAAPVASSFAAPASMSKPKPAQKSASRLRRESLATRGKKADRSSDRQRNSEMALKRRSAAEAKANKGKCGCGGPCCQEAEAKAAVAAAPSSMLSTSVSSSVKAVRRRPVMNPSDSGRMLSRARRAAMTGRGKAGLEAHGKGNSSASLARQANPEISARDLARVVRDSRSKNGARGSSSATPTRARRPRNAAEARQVSGTEVGHTEKLTGDEVGLCHSGITGTEYMSAEVFDNFCQGEAPKAPKKVETSETFSGSRVTSGGKVGGSAILTGTEKGGCRDLTGSEYLGKEYFVQLCNTAPQPSAAKISLSHTQRGTVISGPKASRSDNVTGNEGGTCKAVTGTPYASSETFESFCSTDEKRQGRQRSVMPVRQGAGKDITGIQPGLSGKQMTGAEEGACQTVSGTPYLAASEVKNVCGAAPARVGEADFPQALGVAAGEFSVMPSVASSTPEVNVAEPIAQVAKGNGAVTGSGYEGQGSVTGAFSMGKGKVSGTEESRFGDRTGNVVKVEPKQEQAATVSRVTGEGIETGLNITGDDWDRGDRVTGTEGGSATQRNPSRRGPMSAMPEVASKREPQVVRESANVTGGSGGSQGLSAITLSGGARG